MGRQINGSAVELPAEEVRICEPGGKGLLFPLLESEQHWSGVFRGALYAAALCYLFLGVNIVADKFVVSIEVITSKKRRVRDKATGRYVTVPVWNGTVANLTLLALGSSAPEILLSVVEIVSRGFHSGALGPSTIIGSAAFNLFMIIAVCIAAIPSTELRAIKENTVFFVTAVFSLLAYIWLVFIVQVSSPDIIQIWEALVTLALLPVLIFVSYAADVGLWPFKKDACAVAPPAAGQDWDNGQLEWDGQQGWEQEGWEEDQRWQGLAGTRSSPWGSSAPQGSDWPGAGHTQQAPAGGVARFLDDVSGGELGLLTDDQGCMVGGPAGVISFAEDAGEVTAGFQRRDLVVPVFRQNGSEGAVCCTYRTEGHSAVPGYDFVQAEGTLEFAPGAVRAEVRLELLPKRLGEHSDVFQLLLEDVEGGAIFNPHSDGGEERCVLTITILNENDVLTERSAALRLGRCLDQLVNLDGLRRSAADWTKGVRDAVLDVGEGDEEPSAATWAFHLVSLPWRLLFALLLPPPALLGGWVCFVFSLGCIGGLTAVVIDFAELFGCVTNIEDSITAITFVALGTSMPDLFASVSSAKGDDTADASIVNVTGSNSVNVFVGIGLPWTMAAIYWKVLGATDEWAAMYPDFAVLHPFGGFVVMGGDLGFGVVVFTVAALMALALIRFRRLKFGGELGGPFGPKVLSSLMLTLLWVFYIGLSIWKVVSGAEDFWSQVGAIVIGVVAVENVMLLCGLGFYLCSLGGEEQRQPKIQTPAEAEVLKPPPALPPLPPPSTPDCTWQSTSESAPALSGWPSAASASCCTSRSESLRSAGLAPALSGWPSAAPARQPQHFEAGIMHGAPMLLAENLTPMVSVEVVSKAISFSSAAMVCLAANRFQRPVRLGRSRQQRAHSPGLQQRAAAAVAQQHELRMQLPQQPQRGTPQHRVAVPLGEWPSAAASPQQRLVAQQQLRQQLPQQLQGQQWGQELPEQPQQQALTHPQHQPLVAQQRQRQQLQQLQLQQQQQQHQHQHQRQHQQQHQQQQEPLQALQQWQELPEQPQRQGLAHQQHTHQHPAPQQGAPVPQPAFQAPPAPPAHTMQRSSSFYSVDSGSAAAPAATAPSGVAARAAAGASTAAVAPPSGSVGVVQSVAGWVSEHRADCFALSVAGAMAAQLA